MFKFDSFLFFINLQKEDIEKVLKVLACPVFP